MILEQVVLDVILDKQEFKQAKSISLSNKGYISHHRQKCFGKDIHHFYQPCPEVEHYQTLGLK